jgi:uncharacterized protein
MASNPPQLGSSATGGVQADWQNREFVELLTSQIRKITEFLNNFDTTARSRLSELNSKLTRLETRVAVLEARLPPVPHPPDATAPAPPAAAASK